jgi:hypothetical protein
MMPEDTHEEIQFKQYLEIKSINNQKNHGSELKLRLLNQFLNEIMQIFMWNLNQIMGIGLLLLKPTTDSGMC